jgi:hypothetical protein
LEWGSFCYIRNDELLSYWFFAKNTFYFQIFTVEEFEKLLKYIILDIDRELTKRLNKEENPRPVKSLVVSIIRKSPTEWSKQRIKQKKVINIMFIYKI